MGNAMSRTRSSQIALLAITIILFVTCAPSSGEILLHDDFDDGVLDTAWQIDLQDALDWTYTESETDLTVTDIEPDIINGGNNFWARVHLSQTFPALSSFQVDFIFSWDCLSSTAAMQSVYIDLLDSDGAPIIGAGYLDAWVFSSGCRYARIGSDSQCSQNELPLSGTASVDIVRSGDLVTIFWDDSPIMADNLGAHIAGVEIIFSFYRYSRQYSIFGTESVDLVNIEGDMTAVDVTPWSSIKHSYRQ